MAANSQRGDPLPPLIDFAHAHLAWTTKDESHARFRVIASAICRPPGAGWQARFALAPMIMAGDAYGDGRLPLDLPYSFQMFASPDHHVIVRDFPGGSPKVDSVAPNSETFCSLSVHAPILAGLQPVAPDLAPDRLADAWPLIARVHARDRDGIRWLLDFPVMHLNSRRVPKPAFQIETGPVLVPRTLLEAGPTVLGCFALGYVFFNRLDRIDLALFGPIAKRRGRAFGHFGRLNDVRVELFRSSG